MELKYLTMVRFQLFFYGEIHFTSLRFIPKIFYSYLAIFHLQSWVCTGTCVHARTCVHVIHYFCFETYILYLSLLHYCSREASHHIYVHENPQLDSHIIPRGSICSVRKGSYDLKSLSSEGKFIKFYLFVLDQLLQTYAIKSKYFLNV